MNSLRIIGGQWRSRRLPILDYAELRPSKDAVRETLFNWLQAEINGAQVADLFAGTGALGFEAASRGASQVCMVEKCAPIAKHLGNMQRQLGAHMVSIYQQDARSFWQLNRAKFDIVLLDPPFASDCSELFTSICQAQVPCIYIEQARSRGLPQLPAGYSYQRQKQLGQVIFALARRLSD